MKIEIIRSSKEDNARLKPSGELELVHKFNIDMPTIYIDSTKTYQTHLGFGGAFTESACYVLSKMSKVQLEEVMNKYFSKEGLNYNLGRTCINSSDFSFGNYDYLSKGSTSLETFSLAHEDKWVVPIIKLANAVHKDNISLLASPWSPPAFMKDNLTMSFGGKLKKEYAHQWAIYMSLYIKEMRKRNVSIDYLSIQNEPEATQRWESMLVSAEEERDFIKFHLRKVLDESKLSDIKLIVWDHNKDQMVRRGSLIYVDKDAYKATWGLGYHWYCSEAHTNLTMLHDLFPDKHILFTEGCVEISNDIDNSPPEQKVLGIWEHGEIYGRNIINDFNNYCEGWIDWNMVLDNLGGPNHVKNYCEAPVMFDIDKEKIIYNPSFYFIAHFAHYIEVGAKRIKSSCDVEKGLYVVSYLNLNGDIISVIQNEKEDLNIAYIVDGNGANIKIPKKTIITIIAKK